MNPSVKVLTLLSSSWHPRKLFGGSELGAVLNPSNLPAVKQDSTGVTAGAVGSPVGLLFDERHLLARGADFAVNGSFDDGTTGYTAGANVTLTVEATFEGRTTVAKTVNNSTTGLTNSRAISGLVAGKAYEVEAWAYAPSANTRVNAAAFYVTETTSAATRRAVSAEDVWQKLSFVFVAASTSTTLFFNAGTATGLASSGDIAYFDSFTIKEVLGSHGLQAVADSRPALAAGGKIDYDGVDDSLVITFPSDMGTACTVGRSVPQGEATILTGQTITTTYTDSTDHCGLVIINRALSATETNQLRRWLNRRAG